MLHFSRCEKENLVILMMRVRQLLDEPEAALSCQNQLALLYLIQSCVKQNCQFIIATHSPILLGFPGAQILSFDEGKIEEVDYKSTSSYQTMKLFLDRYDYFVKDIKENEI